MFLKVRKNKARIMLVAVFIIGALGIFFYSKYNLRIEDHKKKIGKAILNGIPKTALHHFIFSKAEALNLNWEHQKEFEYKNQMYDVVKAKLIDGKIHYWCWKDDKESELHFALQSVIYDFFGSSNEDQNIKIELLKLKASLYCNKTFVFNSRMLSLLNRNDFTYGFSVQNSDKEVLSPPPEIN